MKFFAVLSGAAAVSALGTPAFVKRDAAAVSSAFPQIQSAAAALDSSVKGLTNSNVLNMAAPLESASSNLVSLIQSTTKNVGSGYSAGDAAGLAIPVQSLTTVTEATISDIIAKKSVFDSASLGGVVLSQLQMVYSASQALSSALSAAVPSSFQGAAAALSSPLLAAIQSGVSAYTGDTGSASAGASSAPASTAAPASSSAAAPVSSSAAMVSSSAAAAPVSSSAAASKASTSAATAPTGSTAPISTGAAAANVISVGAAAAALLVAAAL